MGKFRRGERESNTSSTVKIFLFFITHWPLHITETTFSVRIQYTRLVMLQSVNLKKEKKKNGLLVILLMINHHNFKSLNTTLYNSDLTPFFPLFDTQNIT